MTKNKRFISKDKSNNTVWEQMPLSRKSVTKTSLRPKPTKKGGCGVSKQDLNIKVRDDGVYILETENYRFHLDEKTHVEKMGRLINENEQLKQQIKELEVENEAQSDAIDGLQEFIAHHDLEGLE